MVGRTQIRKIKVQLLRPGEMKRPVHIENARPGRPDRALLDRKMESPYLERDEVPSKVSPLVFIGGVAACCWVGIAIAHTVELSLLLDRHALFGLLRPGEAVAAAAQKQSTGNQSGGEKGRKGGACRTVHGNTGLITGLLA